MIRLIPMGQPHAGVCESCEITVKLTTRRLLVGSDKTGPTASLTWDICDSCWRELAQEITDTTEEG